jgi:small conductance mechanosensitive channel
VQSSIGLLVRQGDAAGARSTITYYWLLCCALAVLMAGGVWAETGAVDQTPEIEQEPVLQPLSEESVAELDQQIEQMAEYQAVNRQLELLHRGSSELMQEVIGLRLAENWTAAIESSLQFATTVLTYQRAGKDVEPYDQIAIEKLKQHPTLADKAGRAIETRMVLPDPAVPMMEQASASNRLFALIGVRDGLNQLIFRSLDLSKEFGLDMAEFEKRLGDGLANRAANYSVMLSMTMDEVKGTREAMSIIPSDADVTAQLALSQNQVRALANALSNTVSMLNTLGRGTAGYREQIIGATGEISTDILDPEVLVGLLRSWGLSAVDVVVKDGPNVLLKLLIFMGIFLVFRRLSKIVRRLVEKALNRSGAQLSQLLRDMILSLCANVVMVIGVLIALSQVGIALGPLLAGMGVAGFVIGFALQDTLSNFASGMMILSYRPFDVGDVVEAGGVSGTVSHMSLVNTTIMTFDNQTIVVPNNKIWGDVIKNVTSQMTRRVDLVFGIGYEDDIVKTEKVLHEICAAHKHILKEPKPLIHLHQLADSSVNFIVRPWVKTADYWRVYWDITRTVKLRFDQENISIPYPQRDVHVDISQSSGTAQDSWAALADK